jgi:hypothetical protein
VAIPSLHLVTLISASASSFNAAHLNEHLAPVKKRKMEEGRKLLIQWHIPSVSYVLAAHK